VCEAECTAQGSSLGDRQLVDLAQCRSEQLVQRRKRELRLGLDTAGAQQVHVGGALSGVLEQRRLPDARVAAQDERAASGGACGLEQAADRVALIIPPVEHELIVTARRDAQPRALRDCDSRALQGEAGQLGA